MLNPRLWILLLASVATSCATKGELKELEQRLQPAIDANSAAIARERETREAVCALKEDLHKLGAALEERTSELGDVTRKVEVANLEASHMRGALRLLSLTDWLNPGWIDNGSDPSAICKALGVTAVKGTRITLEKAPFEQKSEGLRARTVVLQIVQPPEQGGATTQFKLTPTESGSPPLHICEFLTSETKVTFGIKGTAASSITGRCEVCPLVNGCALELRLSLGDDKITLLRQ